MDNSLLIDPIIVEKKKENQIQIDLLREIPHPNVDQFYSVKEFF